MESEIAPTSPKRAKLSVDETDEKTKTEDEGENSSRTSVESTSPALNSSKKSETAAEDVVVISSDDDSDKDGNKIKSEEQSPVDVSMKSEVEDKTSSLEQPSEEPATTEKPKEEPKDNDEQTKEESSTKPEETSNSSNINNNESKSSSKSPESDECISQEDLLAHLGLGSVRAISNPKPKKEERISNGVLTERRPLIPHKPKESIVDLLRAPKLKSHEEKGKTNGETPVTVVNGVSDDDASTPASPSETDDDELIQKEQLIEELRQELRNEEAKLLLLKKIQAAQNDPKGSMKYTKEKENEKLLSGVQYSSGSKTGSNQLTKKNQSLPPPPPLKTHISTTGTYQPPVAIQPKILPKVGSVQSIPGASIHVTSSKQVNQLQSSKSQTRSGSSAIKDLQNVISSMSTNLIHPTPMYPRAGAQGSTLYTTHSQNSPVRPTPVRANNPSSNSSGYASFTTHISSKASMSTPAVTSAGKQAAAKMALRKQLEKTLLQIPPPKPPPAEWAFIPNLNSAEFMTLVGFEKVVDAIALKESSKGKTPPLKEKVQQENPKVCGQCGTDFTPCWKTKNKEGIDILMCEKCSTVNVKKELKTEHTARLKAAFLKALKQEQEIEQKMSESTPIAPKPQSSKSSSHQSSSSSNSSSSSRHHHVSHHGGVLHRHRHVQGLYHHHQQHTDSLLYQLQQQHLQQQQQEMEVAARRHGDVRWHPYIPQHHHSSSSSHKPQHHHSIVSDSDRQYLLDMIPSLPAQSLNYSSSRI